MENIIFYTLLLVCIGLLFIVGYNFTKINKYKSNAQFWSESFNDVSKRLQELTKKEADDYELFKTAIQVRDETIGEQNETIEAHIMTIDEKQKQIIEQAKVLQKQNDELTIKNTTIESLTNHLQDNHKQDKPFNVLDSLEDLIPRKIETKKTRPKTKNGLKINYPDKNDFRNNV